MRKEETKRKEDRRKPDYSDILTPGKGREGAMRGIVVDLADSVSRGSCHKEKCAKKFSRQKFLVIAHIISVALISLYIMNTLAGIPLAAAAMSEKSMEEIGECLKQSTPKTATTPNAKKEKKSKKMKKRKMLSFHFGDAAVETLGAVDNHQIASILALGECTKLKDSTLYLPSTDSYNITQLTGTFKTLLPDVYDNLMLAAKHGIERAQWEDGWEDGSDHRDAEQEHHEGREGREGRERETIETIEPMPSIEQLGIRHVQLMSIDKGGLDEYRDVLKKKMFDTRNGKAFVISPQLNENEFKEKRRCVYTLVYPRIHIIYTLTLIYTHSYTHVHSYTHIHSYTLIHLYTLIDTSAL